MGRIILLVMAVLEVMAAKVSPTARGNNDCLRMLKQNLKGISSQVYWTRVGNGNILHPTKSVILGTEPRDD
jgi:hypothetical protein